MTALGLGLGLPFGGRISNPLYSLGATFAVDARDAGEGSQWVPNRGISGRYLDLQVGSVGRAELINGIGLRLPGASGNYASIPHNANLVGSTELEIIFFGAITNTAAGSNHALISKWANSSATNCWRVDSLDGNRFIFFYHDGTTGRSINFAYGTRPTDTRWWRFVFQCNSGGVARIDVYNQPASPTVPISWGTATVATGTACVSLNPADTSEVRVGITDNTFLAHVGSFSRVIVRTTIGGSNIVDIDFAAQSSLTTSFTATSGQTVTIAAVSGSDTNDPLLLMHTGTNYLYLPGTLGNCASTPDSAALDITGDIEMVARIAPTDYSTGVEQRIISKRVGAPRGNYEMFLTATGQLAMDFNGTGSVWPSTVILPYGNAVPSWVKITKSASTGVIKFYHAADQSTEPTSWTQLGADVFSGVLALIADTNDLFIGSIGTAFTPFDGKIYRTIVRNGIGGTTVFDADFSRNSAQSSFTESSSNAATVTINRTATARKSVMVIRPCWLFSDDYFRHVTANTISMGTGPYTLVVIHRNWNPATIYQSYMGNRGAAAVPNGVEVSIHWDGSRKAYLTEGTASGDSAVSAATGLVTAGDLNMLAAGRTSTGIFAQSDLTRTDSTPGFWNITADNAVNFFGIGCRYLKTGAADYIAAEVFAAAYFDKELTTSELAQIVSYYGTA